MEGRAVEKLLQVMWSDYKPSANSAFSSFEDIFLEISQGFGLHEQSTSEEINRDELSDIVEKSSHTSGFLSILILSPGLQVEVKEDRTENAIAVVWTSEGKHLIPTTEAESNQNMAFQIDYIVEPTTQSKTYRELPWLTEEEKDVKEGRFSGFIQVEGAGALGKLDSDRTGEVFEVPQGNSNSLYQEFKSPRERDQRGDTDGKAQELLGDRFTGTIRFVEDKTHNAERVERPQPQPSYEPKHINIRLEEGSVRFMLSGDRLRLSMNLNENFYRQPTTFEVHRLVQSLQSLGLNLEVLKLNGSSLYSSDQRQGAKKESREKSHMLFISEPSENTAKSFSLYL